eukprot:CAMPEP_0174828110 /NCGR_PEP_ID=MMETSP1114-20130205/1144_1 /TAXON_ID=312471 /ORGANISM="Neobodo designis, Strain CCAP 1951/1" /LENGTH=561 /DNA_ID=CAMNT_0016061819 /DNA_START=65 /DNA_END=1750 /DNA_ORIENTATION=-
MAQTALPDAEAARYDRSLRLWGAAAQKLLGSAHVVLLGATSTGCEMLKNLVLPGLGNFTVVDGKPVTRRDLGNNFFLEQSDEGRNRAEATAPIIAELNPLASGRALPMAVDDVVAKGVDYIVGELGATLVIASSDVGLSQLMALSTGLRGRGVPLVYAACNGMAGAVRIQADPMFILHTVPGPDTKVNDLRPLNPFPALEAFFQRYDPADETTDHHDFAHTPWFCVVFHALAKWRAGRADGKHLPTTGAEWKEVKGIIDGYARVDPVTKIRKIPDSFKDAKENCSVRLDVTRRNTPELNAVLNDRRAAAPSKDDDVTWFLAHGLRRFREAHGGVMPHSGPIPDFECTTAMYRELQQLFRAEAEANARELGAYAREALAAAGLDPAKAVDDEQIAEFSRQAWELNYVTYPTIADEFTPGAADGLSCPLRPDAFNGAYTQGFNWYVAHRAGLIYAQRHGGVPAGRAASAAEASAQGPVDAAADELAEIVKSDVWPDAPIAELRPRELAEWARYGGSEVVTVASIVGAVASQECIKLIQKRRRPVSHTLIYDGVENAFTTIGQA